MFPLSDIIITQSQACSQDFAWGGGGGGGGVHMSASGTNPARCRCENIGGCGGILPQEILKKIIGNLLGNKAGRSEGYKVECIIESNLESHNLVQNIPHESTNDGPSITSISMEKPFPFISLI